MCKKIKLCQIRTGNKNNYANLRQKYKSLTLRCYQYVFKFTISNWERSQKGNKSFI